MQNLRSCVGIVGVGLIGGSIGLRLKFSGYAKKVIGIGRNRKKLLKAKSLGAIDELSTDYKALKKCDLVILCLPVDVIPAAFKKIEKVVGKDTVITDVGSVKLPIVKAYKENNYNFIFVPSHPIAGSHVSGVEGADKTLFMGRKAVVCLDGLAENHQAVGVVKAMYNFLGMDVIFMDAAVHDEVMAYASHLPHLISFALNDVAEDARYLGAQSLADMTRIASSSKNLWQSIFQDNRANLLKSAQKFKRRFNDYITKIKENADLGGDNKKVKMRRLLNVIAIDGPAGAGKSTIAKALAQRLDWMLLDTGAMYRAATLACMRAGIELDNVRDVLKIVKAVNIELSRELPQKVYLNGENVSKEIRKADITRNVFYLAREPKVREIMVSMQRKMVQMGQCVIEGRDITTVVVPDGEFKFYLDADFNERLKRRRRDLKEKGLSVPESLEKDMIERDANDLCRDIGPLRKSLSTQYLDTTSLSIEDVVNILYYRVISKALIGVN